jgi:hypothetical protein
MVYRAKQIEGAVTNVYRDAALTAVAMAMVASVIAAPLLTW